MTHLILRTLRNLSLCLLALAFVSPLSAQKKTPKIPSVFTGIEVDDKGKLFIDLGKGPMYEVTDPPNYTLSALKGDPKGTETGIAFNFDDDSLRGSLYYGFIPYGDSRHPHPVYFRSYTSIEGGEAHIAIAGNMEGVYDMVGWKESGKGTIGYRVVSERGRLLYDGIVSFKGTGPFEVDMGLVEGPTVNKVTPEGAVIAFETNKSTKASVEVNGETIKDKKSTTHHEIALTGLEAGTEYEYTVNYGGNSQTYSFKTAPAPGSRTAFSFAYASDSRAGNGGGERNLYGANFYIMKKIMALATQQEVAFMQFSGDLINGYVDDPDEINLQYANWKRAIEPFNHYFPVYVSMGNHEALSRSFRQGRRKILRKGGSLPLRHRISRGHFRQSIFFA